jgi:UDP-N-acetylmuramoyl-tripeptide--D-alanyl-D-alanine ligase
MDSKIFGVSTDTRTLNAGNLFIPLTGPNFNGHNFLARAVAGGARAFLTEKAHRNEIPVFPNEVAWVEVDHTLTALGDIAHTWRKRFGGRVIAITGSAGKTTTKEMIATICALDRNIRKTEGNFNNLIGLPLTLLGLQEGIDLAILELGTNAPGEIERLTRLAEPDIGVITNIGPAHLEGLGTVSAVREEKGMLFHVMDQRGVAVLNLDDPEIEILRKRWQGDCITFSLSAPADITAENIRPVETWKTAFTLNIRGIKEAILLSIPGLHNVRNALAAAAAAMATGCEPSLIGRGLHAVRPVSGRMEIETLSNGAYLIHDAYNANPLSVSEALKTLVDISGSHRRIVFMGDMLELGAEAKHFHEKLGGQIGRSGIHRLFLKGEFSQVMAEAAVAEGLDRKQIFFFNGPAEAIPALREVATGGDWILLKGSRKMNLNELIPDIRRLGDQEKL